MKKFFSKIFPTSKTHTARVTDERKTSQAAAQNYQRSLSEDYYYIDPNKKGLVIGFIQTKNRPGSKFDEDYIRDTFENRLGCVVRIYRDKNTEEIERILSQVRKEDEEDFNFLVTFVSGHGGSDENGEYLECRYTNPVKDWRDSLRKKDRHFVERIPLSTFKQFIKGAYLDKFRAKPKLLIWQCCRGPNENPRVPFNPNSVRRKPSTYSCDLAQPIEDAPQVADYAIIYASDDGNVAYRHPDSGSLLIQLFCAAVAENPNKDLMATYRKISGQSGQMRVTNHSGPDNAITFIFECQLQKLWQFQAT